MNINRLKTQIKRLEKKIKGYIIDFDDPDYAIFKLRENSEYMTIFLSWIL